MSAFPNVGDRVLFYGGFPAIPGIFEDRETNEHGVTTLYVRGDDGERYHTHDLLELHALDCECHQCRPCETVKRVDLFGNVIDTHMTERELNGWRESQGRML